MLAIARFELFLIVVSDVPCRGGLGGWRSLTARGFLDFDEAECGLACLQPSENSHGDDLSTLDLHLICRLATNISPLPQLPQNDSVVITTSRCKYTYFTASALIASRHVSELVARRVVATSAESAEVRTASLLTHGLPRPISAAQRSSPPEPKSPLHTHNNIHSCDISRSLC